ncbi:hypothetical protein [Lentzea sp. CC55]|nr:hypothetical protein [Lentzea sp. CC55]
MVQILTVLRLAANCWARPGVESIPRWSGLWWDGPPKVRSMWK